METNFGSTLLNEAYKEVYNKGFDVGYKAGYAKGQANTKQTTQGSKNIAKYQNDPAWRKRRAERLSGTVTCWLIAESRMTRIPKEEYYKLKEQGLACSHLSNQYKAIKAAMEAMDAG